MLDPATTAELVIADPMVGARGTAVIGAILIGMSVAVVYLLVRSRTARIRLADRLERTLAKPVELREGVLEIAGTVEPIDVAKRARTKPVLRIRRTENASTVQRGTQWYEGIPKVSISPFYVRPSGSDERVRVEPGDVVKVLAPRPRMTPNEKGDTRSGAIEIRPGDRVIVSGILKRTAGRTPGNYREAPREWQLGPHGDGAVVVTPALAVEQFRTLPNPDPQSRGGAIFGLIGVAATALVVIHMALFQLAGPVVEGTVSRTYASEDRKSRKTTMMAEIRYGGAGGSEHEMRRGYSYFRGTPRVGMRTRVKHFPGLAADGELAFDQVSCGLLDLFGGIFAVIPLAVGLLSMRRVAWETPETFSRARREPS